MSNLLPVLLNAARGMLGTALAIPIQTVVFILVARNLGVERYGIYGFAMEFGYLFSCLAEGGLGILATREIARNRSRAGIYVGNLFFIKLILTVAFYLTMAVTGHLLGFDPRTLHAVYILGAANFLYVITRLISGVFRAYERMEFEGLINLAQAVVFFLLIASVVWVFEQGATIVSMSVCLLLSYTLSVGAGFWIMSGYIVRPVWTFDTRLVARLSREAIPLALAWILVGAYSRVGIMVLKGYSSVAELGFFNVSFRVAFNLGIVPYFVAGAWLPIMARAAHVDLKQFQWATSQLYRMLLLLSVPLTLALSLLASPIVDLVYGDEYAPATVVLQILMWYTLLVFIAFGGKTVLESCGKQIWWTVALALGLVVGFGLSLHMVPQMHARGAAIATVGGSLVTALVTSAAVVKLTSWRPDIKILLRIIVSNLAMAVFIYWLRPVSWVLAGLGGMVIYGTSLVLLREIKREQLVLSLRHIVQGKGR